MYLVKLNLSFFFSRKPWAIFSRLFKWKPLKATKKKLVFISVCKHFSFQGFSISFLLHNCISREMLKNHRSYDIAFFSKYFFWNIFGNIDWLIIKLSEVVEYHKMNFLLRRWLKYGNIQFLFSLLVLGEEMFYKIKAEKGCWDCFLAVAFSVILLEKVSFPSFLISIITYWHHSNIKLTIFY